MESYVLEEKIIYGRNMGENFFPRLSLTLSYKIFSFKFQHRQFSLMVLFAMTINKSQGQSLKHINN